LYPVHLASGDGEANTAAPQARPVKLSQANDVKGFVRACG
jgi:hypothetical protein